MPARVSTHRSIRWAIFARPRLGRASLPLSGADIPFAANVFPSGRGHSDPARVLSFNDPPVDAAVIITVAVFRGDKIKFDTVDVAAHGVEKRIECRLVALPGCASRFGLRPLMGSNRK